MRIIFHCLTKSTITLLFLSLPILSFFLSLLSSSVGYRPLLVFSMLSCFIFSKVVLCFFLFHVVFKTLLYAFIVFHLVLLHPTCPINCFLVLRRISLLRILSLSGTPKMARSIDRCVTLSCFATFLIIFIVSSPYVATGSMQLSYILRFRCISMFISLSFSNATHARWILRLISLVWFSFPFLSLCPK